MEKKNCDFFKLIKNSRDIKESSCLTYLSALKKIKKQVDGNIKLIDVKFLEDFNNIMNIINKEKKITSKKNKLTAVLVALNSDKEKYKDLIDKYGIKLKELGDKYMNFLKTQTKTETQKKNWIQYKELIYIINKIKNEIQDKNIIKKTKLDNDEFNTLQQYIVIRTYLDNPLRNDFANMKVIKKDDYDKLTYNNKNNYNYLVKNGNNKQFMINQFKNRKYMGPKILQIKPQLNKLINLWLKFNTSGWFFVQTDKQTPLSPNYITKILNRIFKKYANKKISSSLLRHIIISKALEGKPTIKQKEKEEKDIENKFFHNGMMNDLYRKID